MDTINPQNRQNHISINLDFTRRGAVEYITQIIQDNIQNNNRVFKIRPKETHHAFFPNTCVPISGIIDHFRSKENCKFVESKAYSCNAFLSQSGIINPYELGSNHIPQNALNCVWKFNPDTQYEVVKQMMDAFRRVAHMSDGVLESLEMSTHEITDNIIQHSQSNESTRNIHGYIMGQYHKSNNRIAIAVFDTGQGILESLRSGTHDISSTEQALQLALQRGISDGHGAGNGLWIMERIVSASCGKLDLASDGIIYSVNHIDNTQRSRSSITRINRSLPGTTLVDFQLNGDIPINLTEALDGHEAVNLWAESYLEEDLETSKVIIADDASGFGSRYDAKQLSNYILNLIQTNKGSCILDFQGVKLISASFADELIKNLVIELGIIGFSNTISFKNMNSICAMMFDSCFKHRIQDSNGRTRTYKNKGCSTVCR